MEIIIHSFPVSPYSEVLAFQEKLFSEAIESKQNGILPSHHLILCEHEPVFTLGKSGKRENILVSDEKMEAEYYKISRGGDVTFHGPGQLVVYPIFDLEQWGVGIAQFVFMLEETIIRIVAKYGLKGERLAHAAGIWLMDKNPSNKIGAIGIKASRMITMHGLAINVNTDLSYFDKIIACGLEGKGTTSLEKETGYSIEMSDFRKEYLNTFEEVFTVNYKDKGVTT